MNPPYDPYGRQADTRQVFNTDARQEFNTPPRRLKREWTGSILVAIAAVIATIIAAIIGAITVIYVQNVDASKEVARDKREAYLGFLEEVTACTEPTSEPPPPSDPVVPKLKPASFMPAEPGQDTGPGIPSISADPEQDTGPEIQINAERCEKIEAAFNNFSIHAPRELTEEAESILRAISRLPSTSDLGLSVVLSDVGGPKPTPGPTIHEVHDLISKFRVMVCKELSVDEQSCDATASDKPTGTP